MKQQKPSILIVGAGPVGMVLASQLIRYGINPTIIEKREDFTQGSKALSINAASLKIFDNMGLINQFLAKGKKVRHINVYWNNQRFIHIDYMWLKNCPYNFYLTLPQPETEKILANHLQELNCFIERRVTFKSLHQTKHYVEAELEYADGSINSKKYEYVIGCDGARSTVREVLGKKFSGHDYNMYFLFADVKLNWSGLCDETHYFVKEDGFIIIIPLTNGLHRIVIKENSNNLADMHKTMKINDYQAILDYYGPGNITIEKIIWESSAPFYNRLVESYREGRVFLAGDAAHLFSPIGGLGMNTGLQDAYNLAWKLAGVIKKDFNPEILHTYETERLEIAGQLIQGTDETTKLITRLDSDIEGNLQRWMPKMKNRIAIKNIWPLVFSGLGQKYPVNDFNTCGVHVPYAKGANNSNNIISTYRFTQDHYPTLLVFQDKRNMQLSGLSKKISFINLRIICQSVESMNNFNTEIILDIDQNYLKAFKAKEGDVFLIRPDGYIGLQSHVSRFHEILQYLEIFKRGEHLYI